MSGSVEAGQTVLHGQPRRAFPPSDLAATGGCSRCDLATLVDMNRAERATRRRLRSYFGVTCEDCWHPWQWHSDGSSPESICDDCAYERDHGPETYTRTPFHVCALLRPEFFGPSESTGHATRSRFHRRKQKIALRQPCPQCRHLWAYHGGGVFPGPHSDGRERPGTTCVACFDDNLPHPGTALRPTELW
jgi:hypothetical protein